ncbi:MAG: AAA family ATPase [Candidatus Bipolaricaulia bacterium]
MADRKRQKPHDEPRRRPGGEPERENEPGASKDPDPDQEARETQIRALAILDEILMQTPADDPQLGLLELLRHQLEVDELQLQEAQDLIAEFEEIYEKLTSPANRIGTYLDSPDEEIAYIALGDSEYYVNVDPNIDLESLKVGTRVRLNEAFVIIGDLGYHPQGPIVKVAEVLDDGRLRISTEGPAQSGRLVMRSSALERETLKPGDEVRMEPSLKVAIESFQRREARDYYLEKIPEIPWSRIGGQKEAIQLIRDTIERPLLYPELYERFGKRTLKGILLYGPPGCGKTLIAKATAYNLTQAYSERIGKDVREYFMFINGPQLLNMWLGETERMVREIFSAARERAAEGYLVFVFIDEADSLLRARSSGRYLNIANTVVPQFSGEMDGLVGLENVVVMLTSNRPDYIDPAVLRPERISRKVKIGRPDHDSSAEIFSIYLHEDVPLDPAWVERCGGDSERARRELIERATDYLFRRTRETAFLKVSLRSGRRETLYWRDLVSGALIESAVERAKEYAIRRWIDEQSEGGVNWENLNEAIQREYQENEIFPKADMVEDWLKLLDHEPENVVEVHPAQERDGKERRRDVDSVV